MAGFHLKRNFISEMAVCDTKAHLRHSSLQESLSVKKLFFVIAGFALSWLALGADPEPVLQWVKTIGGSGHNSLAAATSDGRGNLYMVGNTTSLDFPIVGATQSTAGGST